MRPAVSAAKPGRLRIAEIFRVYSVTTYSKDAHESTAKTPSYRARSRR
jgi:hypothetical protein